MALKNPYKKFAIQSGTVAMNKTVLIDNINLGSKKGLIGVITGVSSVGDNDEDGVLLIEADNDSVLEFPLKTMHTNGVAIEFDIPFFDSANLSIKNISGTTDRIFYVRIEYSVLKLTTLDKYIYGLELTQEDRDFAKAFNLEEKLSSGWIRSINPLKRTDIPFNSISIEQK